MTSSIAAIASRCLAVAPCSFEQVIAKMQRIATDSDCSIPLISGIVISDPMLTALIISRACVGTDTDTTTVSASVAKLGLASIQGLCQDIVPVEAQHATRIASHWSHANACAHMTRLLSRFCHATYPQRGDDEALSILGLLHDLGNPLANLLFEEDYAAAEEDLLQDETSTFEACLHHTLGVTTHHIGALVARAWHLPDDIRTVIRWYHEPERAIEHREVTALVHIAHNLVKGCGFTAGADIFVAPIRPAAMSLLGLRNQDLLTCLKRFFEEMEELSLYEASFIQQ